jgi:alkylated DNA repair dioxygenase AlkB
MEGLIYIPDLLVQKTVDQVLSHIEAAPWQSSLTRRVQQYGPVYNYSTKKLDEPVAEIPEWLQELVIKPIKLLNVFHKLPDQVIINEYMPGQGISRHIDSPLFGPVVGSISLLSDSPMIFGRYGGSEHPVQLAKNSIALLTGAARSDWYHMIPSVKDRRVSITLRTIN